MIPWRWKHRLFGWDYVHLRNTADNIIRRVRRTGAGERFVRYYGQSLVFIDRPGAGGWTVTELTRAEPAPAAVIAFPTAAERRRRP